MNPVVMFFGSFFAPEIRQRLFLLSLGAFGVGGGVLNFSKAKKMPNQPLEPTAPSGRGSS